MACKNDFERYLECKGDEIDNAAYALAVALLRTHPDQTDEEVLPWDMTDFCEILKLKKHNVIGNDLLTAETAPIYDAVVMNPPFSEECEHIKRAFDFLRPGGSLVAVCSSSIQWKSTRKYEQFRDWLSEHTHSIDECGAKFEMTGVHTVVLVVDKAA